MNTKCHGIKIGDLVKFKHHIFDGLQPIHLVTEVFARDRYTWEQPARRDEPMNIRLHGNSGITHRANNFVVVKRA
jgi:hypothetical protein